VKGLQGKKALVTGGSSGIGQAIAIRLGEEGVDVAINYVGPPESAQETKEVIEHGVEICMKEMSAAGTHPVLVAADVSDEDQVGAMFEQALAEYGRIDFLVNNAGIQIAADTDQLAVAAFDKVLAVNLRGAFLCAQQAIRSWLSTGAPGGIVNASPACTR
jgi:glucose 1-dehydrogenase